jgi:hypothetical protein
MAKQEAGNQRRLFCVTLIRIPFEQIAKWHNPYQTGGIADLADSDAETSRAMADL